MKAFKGKEWFNKYKYRCLTTVGVVGLLAAASWAGNQYVQANTNEVFHVLVNGKDAGTVSNKAVVASYVQDRYTELEKEYPNVHMKLNDDEIAYRGEKAFKAKSDNDSTLQHLDGMLTAAAVGVELRVNNKTVAVVKDEQTAKQILTQIKNQYLPKKDQSAMVEVLSANADAQQDDSKPQTELKDVGFVEDVKLDTVSTTPDKIVSPDVVLKKLETGDVKPTKYKVQEGDTLWGISDKFGIPEDMIRQNNPQIKGDMLHIDDELDLTIRQPALSVKTVEDTQEVEEVHYDTDYVQDDTLVKGREVVVQAGKEGKKRVTFQVTKINGIVMDENLIKEEILVKPVTAIIKRGTKVIKGQGTGSFAWPVHHPRITSGFGQRWGTLHKGIDMISSDKSILAADNGKVTFAGVKSGYGNCIIIDHRNGYSTLYGHMSKLLVSEGDTVEKGEKIGIMGETGDATGVHLHFEIHKNGDLQNPINYLNQ